MNQVFEQFVEAMKVDPQVGEDIALKVKSIIDSGGTINQKAVEGALFPSENVADDAKA